MIRDAIGKEILIIDDAIPKQLFEHIRHVLEDDNFEWNYNPKTAGVDYENNPLLDSSFYSIVYAKGSNTPDPKMPIFALCNAGLLCALSKTDLVCSELQRIRICMHTAAHIKHRHAPHVDGIGIGPYAVGLLYLHDSDGETFIYNKRSTDFAEEEVVEAVMTPLSQEELDDNIVIESKANRIVFFDGSLFHSSVKQTTPMRRMTINYNLFVT